MSGPSVHLVMTSFVVDAAASLRRAALSVDGDVSVVGAHAALGPWQAALLGRVGPLTRRETRRGRRLVHHAPAARQS